MTRKSGRRFSLATNAERVCAETMLNQKPKARPGRGRGHPSRLLANPFAITHNSFIKWGRGIHIGGSIRKMSAWFVVCDGARAFDAANQEPCLHPGRASGLQRRCASALRFGNSRCRSCHDLHGQEKIGALAGMSGVLQAHPRGHGCRPRRQIRARQAGGGAQTRASEVAQA